MVGKARGDYEIKQKLEEQIRSITADIEAIGKPRTYEQSLRLKKAQSMLNFLCSLYNARFGKIPEIQESLFVFQYGS